MKTIRFSWMAIMAAAFVLSCAKEENAPLTNDNNGDQPGAVTTKTVTISAKLSEAMTKVGFTPTYTGNKPTEMTLTWEAGDKIRVYNHENHYEYSDFVLASESVGQQIGLFIGTPISATSYDVEVINGDVTFATQTQPSDGVTSDLKYLASVSGIDDYSSINFTSFSSVLAITVKMPSTAIAAKVKSIDIKAYKSDGTTAAKFFSTGNTLNVTFDTIGDAGNDGILNFYATLPQGTKDIAAGTQLIVKVNAPGETHSVYTRFVELGSGLSFTANKLNTININAINSASYANANATEIGTASNPYLIGDKYQLSSLNLASGTTYIKLVDDIDMTGLADSWTSWNGVEPFDMAVNLDGNNKKISKMTKALFDDLNGTVNNLTIEDAIVSGGTNITGILANTVKTAASTLTNVDVVGTAASTPYSSTVSVTTGAAVGGLIGKVSQVSSPMLTATGCDVINTSVSGVDCVGGVFGHLHGGSIILNCSYSGAKVSGSGQYIGGFTGRTETYTITITECSVKNTTVTGSKDQDIRIGGFSGLIDGGTQAKGCIVGASDRKVIVNNSTNTADSKTLRIGGFSGLNYGTITSSDSNRSAAYAQITSANDKGQRLDIGGFVGYNVGMISYSDAVVDMSTLKGQYIGGFVGYDKKESSTRPGSIDNCTVSGSIKGNNYTGGFVAYLDSGTPTISNNTVLSGSTVSGQSSVGGFVGYLGTGSISNNTVETCTMTSNGANVGGFVGGMADGVLTENTTAAAVTSTGATNVLGGFVAYATAGTLTKCSSSGTVTKTTNNGNSIGGFAGMIEGATLSECYSTAGITINSVVSEMVGGFIGNVKPATGKTASIQNCYSEGSVNGKGRWTGGFIGYVYRAADNCGNVEIIKCHSSSTVTVAGYAYTAGFIGRTYMKTGSTLTISKCYSSGNVNSNSSTASPFIAEIGEATNCTISDCYCTGSMVTSSNQIRGGLIGVINGNANTSVSVLRCYASGVVMGSFRLGGLIGNLNNANGTVTDCAAWNSAVTAASVTQTNWSSGAIVGTAHPNCHISNTFRNPDMSLTAYCPPPASDWDQPDINGTTTPLYWNSQIAPFTWDYTTATSISAGSSNADAGRWAYHGKHSSTNRLSTLAFTAKASGGLGWSSEVWDFTGDLPTLK